MNPSIPLSGNYIPTAAPVPPITPQSLNEPVKPLSITPPPPLPNPNIPTVSPPPATPADPVADFSKLVTSLDSKGTDLESAIQSETAPYSQQLNDINFRIKDLQARSIANQEKVMAGGGDTSFQSGEGQRIARNDAIEGI